MANANDWYDALISAKARSRLNSLGYAFAIQWPGGHCTVEDRKPSLRNQQMRVVECTCDGRENLA